MRKRIVDRFRYFLSHFWDRMTGNTNDDLYGALVGSAPFCVDCPDHEGCSQGIPCHVVKKANNVTH